MNNALQENCSFQILNWPKHLNLDGWVLGEDAEGQEREMLPMKDKISVVHCFDEAYAIPAAVSFSSMLENANINFQYVLYVVHKGITEQTQLRLTNLVLKFPNASIQFVEVPDSLDAELNTLFLTTKGKSHFSKEIYYKFLIPLLVHESKVIVTDVDVLWCGDISETWREAGDMSGLFIKGVRLVRRPDRDFHYRHLEKEEFVKLVTAAGLWVFNLDEMRSCGITERAIEFAKVNAERLMLPEQETLNLICFPHIGLLQLKNMVCTMDIELLTASVGWTEFNYSYEEIREAAASPVQLHFAGGVKPWQFPASILAQDWFRCLSRTEFLNDWLISVERDEFRAKGRKRFRVPISNRRCLIVESVARSGSTVGISAAMNRNRYLRVSLRDRRVRHELS